MAKYEDIMESPWINSTLHPESIPHLFHYDLAYLWILEKQADQRPRVWDERIEAWRCLVELLLVGELDVIEEPIRAPLLKYTRSYGINKIYWVSPRRANQRIGVLSPTVLVRPLPDFTATDLNPWKSILANNRRPDEFIYFARLAIKDLMERQLPESFRYKLARILSKEFLGIEDLEKDFRLDADLTPPSGAASTSLQIPILTRLFWTQKSTEASCVQDFELLIRGQGNGRKTYVPRCGRCKHWLTKPRNAASIEVSGDDFQVVCENPSCGHTNDILLENFLIWARNNTEVVVWDRQGILEMPSKGLPPEPQIQDIEVGFEWSGAQLGGEKEKRFLKLLFPQTTVSERKISEILFKRVLVAGKFDEFKGLPIRPEWLDALSNADQVECEPDPAMSKITYRNLKIKGWPVSITRVFSGSLSLKHESKMAVGIYPDPEYVPETWLWYRMFLDGQERIKYRIQMTSGREILPWLHESTKGLDKTLSVLSNSDKDTGITYWISNQHETLPSSNSAEFKLGVDFGTTNTLIYFLPPARDIDDVVSNPTEFCLEPSAAYTLARWLAPIEAPQAYKTIADFLPGPDYRQDRIDPYIIPSALWGFQNQFLIRWDSEDPAANSKVHMGFKWDEKGSDFSAHRIAFLKEILFIAIPSILKNALKARAINSWNLNFRLCFTFPLSFGDEAKGRTIALHKEVHDQLKKLTSFDFIIRSINESSACMALLGRANPDDTFLVADMGGGTIDLALFTGHNTSADQIGSIRFAGESYLEILTRKQGIDALEIRDLIARGKCHHLYGGDTAANEILESFIGFAFEFLRTMVEAYRKDKPDQNIYLVLAGNGWHLVEAFSAQTKNRTARQVFNEHFQFIVDLIGDQRIKLRDPLPKLSSNKHLVAIGALKHSRRGDDELNSHTPTVSQLPAGRSLKFVNKQTQTFEIKWSDLVGGKLPFTISALELRNMASDVDVNDFPPPRPEWRSHILNCFGVDDEKRIPYPDDLRLREQIIECMSEAGPPMLSKGPLQIILEKYWSEWLKGEKGSK